MKNLKLTIYSTTILFFSILTHAQKDLSLDDAVINQYRKYAPDRIANFEWIPGSNDYSFLDEGRTKLVRSNPTTDKVTTIIDIEEVNEIMNTSYDIFYSVSWMNENEVLLEDGYSFIKINLETKKGESFRTDEGESNPLFEPRSGNLAFCIENNVWIRNNSNSIAVTNNSDPNIVSGQSIARSEFGITNGLFWSKNGSYLAFYQKDETNVHNYPLLNNSETPGSLMSIKYPMAGQLSEKPRIGIFNTKTGNTVFIRPEGNEDDYLTNLTFTPDEKYVVIAEVNRAQNHMRLNVYSSEDGNFVKTLLEEKNERWVEPETPAYFPCEKENDFVWMSEKDGYMNLYYYDFNGNLKYQVTNHEFVVKEIIGMSSDKKHLYYSATGENPMNTMVYDFNVKKKKSTLLTAIEGTHRVKISENGKYYFDTYSNGTTPNKSIIYNSKRIPVKTINNSVDKLKDHKIGKTEIGKLLASDNSDLYYRLIKPYDFDSTKQYPVMIYVYGGPHAQLVTNSWMYGASLWMHWMANQGYIVFTMDNRGSANRGFSFESQIHRNLGTLEIEDQMKGVSFLKSLKYVDPHRLAVHGWSYGGFMTTSLMLRKPDVFKVGVAGGPVTDWKYYEVMYGERYMDQPEENPRGYKQASLFTHAENLEGDLLLIHGTIDDVVVMQHNLALVQKFIELGIQMDFFPYPMHKHNVYGRDRVHLMTKILNYIIEHNQ
ncbi:MAG: DPP IV N-terminal domain-containing protein [Bacteroidota bacterium]|nr:DPP IV N-terminal domain-containing protein [Bacteroidota bacterium]